MQFKVKIIETYERIVCVDAPDKTDAVVNATQEYLSVNTLDEDGLVFFKVELIEEEKRKTKEKRKC